MSVRGNLRRWTPDDLATLRVLVPTHTAKSIGKALNRSESSIRNAVHKFQLTLLKRGELHHATKPLLDRLDRFSEYVTESGCQLWTGVTRSGGYGVVQLTGYKNKLAHRVSYELRVGPIAPGLFVCHRCDTPSCINPTHLFLGTALDNSLDAQKKGRLRGMSQTHCVNGHPFTPGNTRPRPSGGRWCVACQRLNSAAYMRRKRKALKARELLHSGTRDECEAACEAFDARQSA